MRLARTIAIATVLKLDARRRLLAILAADAAGYSRLMAVDDHATVKALDAAREVFQRRIVLHDGRVIDMAGDSVLAVFDTAAGAVRAAMDVQEELAQFAQAAPADRRMHFRIGVHLGDVIEKADGTVYGDGVNVAARLQALAEPGSIVVSQAIQGAVGHRARAEFVDLGEHEVKNIAQPVRAFACVAPSAAGDEHFVEPVPAGASYRSKAALRSHPRRMALGAAAVVGLVVATAASWVAVEHFRRPAEVAPYSAADRRLTFAVLPFEAPKGDPQGERLAGSAREEVQALQEARFLFARVTPRPVVQQAVGTPATFKQLGSTLDVHFLIRGSVSRDASGYTLALAMVDADSERVLETKTLRAEPADAPTFKRSEIDAARSSLTFAAIGAEVARARAKPDSALDVRDLTLRAFVDHFSGEFDQATSYARARSLLDRALAIAPNDLLALQTFAQVNLCACIRTWAKPDVIRELEKLGVAALDRYLAVRSDDVDMMVWRGSIFLKHQRYEDALAVADNVLRRAPTSAIALYVRAIALVKLRRAPEAVAASQALLAVVDDVGSNGTAAYVLYAAKDNTSAILHARRAISLMARRDLANPEAGDVVLILAAAEARAGHLDRARLALQDFYAAVPAVRTVEQIKGWLHPDAIEHYDEDFFNGLRLAGVSD